MTLIAVSLVLSILSLLGAIGAIGMVIWHTLGMFRGVRSSASPWVNLVPFLAFSLPGVLDASGQEHRFKMVVWFFTAAALLLASIGLQVLAEV